MLINGTLRALRLLSRHSTHDYETEYVLTHYQPKHRNLRSCLCVWVRPCAGWVAGKEWKKWVLNVCISISCPWSEFPFAFDFFVDETRVDGCTDKRMGSLGNGTVPSALKHLQKIITDRKEWAKCENERRRKFIMMMHIKCESIGRRRSHKH